MRGRQYLSSLLFLWCKPWRKLKMQSSTSELKLICHETQLMGTWIKDWDLLSWEPAKFFLSWEPHCTGRKEYEKKKSWNVWITDFQIKYVSTNECKNYNVKKGEDRQAMVGLMNIRKGATEVTKGLLKCEPVIWMWDINDIKKKNQNVWRDINMTRYRYIKTAPKRRHQDVQQQKQEWSNNHSLSSNALLASIYASHAFTECLESTVS